MTDPADPTEPTDPADPADGTDLLTHLPDAGYPASTRPLPRIITRAHEIRRRRRLLTAGAMSGIAAAAATVVVTVSLLGHPAPGRELGQPAATPTRTSAAEPISPSACRSAPSPLLATATFPELLYLPPGLAVQGQVKVQRVRYVCPAKSEQATAFAVDPASHLVSRTLVLAGPHTTDVYRAHPGTFTGKRSTVSVGDRTVRLYDWGAIDGTQTRWMYAFWHERDGTTWSATARLPSQQTLITALGDVRIRSGAIQTGQPPAGFTTWARPPLPPRKDGQAQQVRSVTVPLAESGSAPAVLELSISDVPSRDLPALGAEQASVGDDSGWWIPGIGGPGTLTWRHNDLEFELHPLTAAAARPDLLEVARSVTLVQPDDPRLRADR